jgi:hypothetical protein
MSELTEELRELDKIGYKPLTGAIGNRAADEINTLRARVAELEEDKAMLNWLELNPRQAQIIIDGEAQDCLYYAVAGAFGVRLRDIIRAAMKERK